MDQSRRARTLLASVVAALATAVAAGAPASGVDAAACAALDHEIHEVGSPRSGTTLLTPWEGEADGAAVYGFTEDRGAPFAASVTVREGLTAVHRLYHPLTADFAVAAQGSAALANAVASGYRDQGPRFWAPTVAVADCTQPVTAWTRGGKHRYAVPAGGAALAAAGWTSAGVAFHARVAEAPPEGGGEDPGDTSFSFAVVPDTQNEVGLTDQRLPKRVDWLLDHREERDLRWVLHIGDVHNWDTTDHIQFSTMSARLKPLDDAGLPFMAAVGNHDTAAVCPGGSACPGANTSITLRDTRTWNAYYPPSRFGLEGVYEAGKSDNGWRTFEAGGLDWLVLDLELWPRPGVVAWADGVIAGHPRHNVILVTHAFLEADGTISTNNGGYGATTPSAMWEVLDDHPNVVMVFSGHVGQAASTSATADDGHKVATFLQALHAPSTNPVRLVTVDTAAGTLETEVRSSWDRSLPLGQQDIDLVHPFSATQTGMRWVR